MRRSVAILAVALVVWAGPSFAAGTFEGEIDMKITHGSDVNHMPFMIKGSKTRIQVETHGMHVAMIKDRDARTVLTLLEERHMAMESAMPQPSEKAATTHANFTKTGKTEEILGYHAEEWIDSTENGVMHLWVTNALGAYLSSQNPMARSSVPEWEAWLEHENMFPLRTVSMKGGNEVSRMDVEKIDARTLDASLFTIPDGYQKMSMPSFGR